MEFNEKLQELRKNKGLTQEELAEITAGDIGVVTKLAGFKTGDTMCDAKNPA